MVNKRFSFFLFARRPTLHLKIARYATHSTLNSRVLHTLQDTLFIINLEVYNIYYIVFFLYYKICTTSKNLCTFSI
jgi:hypothetical protein